MTARSNLITVSSVVFCFLAVALSVGERSPGEPMRRDTNFRIASTTKPVAAVAAVILVEVCRLRLDEADDALQDRVRAVLAVPHAAASHALSAAGRPAAVTPAFGGRGLRGAE